MFRHIKYPPPRPYIGGNFAEHSGTEIESINPANNKVITTIASCGKQEVEFAVECATRAHQVWSFTTPSDKKEILLKFAELVEKNTLELAILDCLEAGKPIKDCLYGDLPETVSCIRYHAEAIDKLYDQVAPTSRDICAIIKKEPIGVVGVIIPWNFPLLMMAWKIAPALATGNTVIVKPSEMTSLSALRVAELATEAGFPPGTLNIVTGFGETVGKEIALHSNVNMVAFTGSTKIGKQILKYSAESNMKKVILECGGKSPQIVFEDADLDTCIPEIASAAFWNMGENCSCGSRLLVHDKIHDKVIDKLLNELKTFIVGDPLSFDTKIGPMINKSHLNKVLEYIETGKTYYGKKKNEKEHDVIILGNTEKVLKHTDGNYMNLTIFDNVSVLKNPLWSEEIFGPILTVVTFDSDENALKLANNSEYGLAASVYTNDLSRAHNISSKLQVGTVSVNCFSEGDMTCPFGGYKTSGFVGRDKGIHAHENYIQTKTTWIKLNS